MGEGSSQGWREAHDEGDFDRDIGRSVGIETQSCIELAQHSCHRATKEVQKTGIFAVPGLARFKVRTKPATKAGKREVFGKLIMVKAKPAKKIVKAFPVAALKKSI